MDSARSSSGIYLRNPDQRLVKVIVSGPFGVGKTTIINTLSDIPPLRTEEVMTATGAVVDHLEGVRDKTTTTVGLDYGRMSLSDDLALCLFGTPGQKRFHALWEDLTQGALGALILADTRRIADSYEVMGLIEEQEIRYAVALNVFPDSPQYPEEDLRQALDLAPETPLITCDARDRGSSLAALLGLAEHLLNIPVLEQS
ncbi:MULTISPECIES: ATP/GTP-binding protein [unclassified Streptomyces]|uniref:ATP/GTP-binding protein n=1 Tax=Streptomyces millisiae TaxID=3075542 RepID=A0ABU2LLQ1_9ACTN|nr:MULTISPECIES: ATP/GTP-binding protein [unclassified Streptomyces]MDT0318198.1 ATP/GTP-binding protein [Streptomyces sp. DSM 44918]